MTELSYVWDGVVTGDATLAPYEKEEFNKFSHLKIISVNTEEFVIPGYLDDLKVEPSGISASGVKVNSGAALLKNYVYILGTEITLPIERVTTANYVRCDLIVLQLTTDQTNSMYQTVRVVVKKGVEASASPAVPAVTQTAQIWEVELARVFVLNIVSYIGEGFVHDKRKFVITDKSKNLYDGSYNLIKNSEYMAVSGTAASTGPDGWLGGPVTWSTVSAQFPMKRGRSIRLQSTGGWYQWIPVGNGCKTFTLKALITKNGVGDTATINVAAVDSLGVTHYPRIIGNFDYITTSVGYEYQETITYDVDDIAFLTVTVSGSSLIAPDIYFGQIILVPGYHPGPFKEFHEIIPLRTPIADTSWDGDAKSTGTTTISLTASFGGRVIVGTRAVILRIRGRDSGSAAGTPSLSIQGYAAPFNSVYGILELSGVTNDVFRELQVQVPVYHPTWYARSTAPSFRVVLAASGAATFDAVVEVVGIVT